MTLGVDSEEKGDYMGLDHLWGVSCLSHILGAPNPGVRHKEDKIPWLVGGLLKLTGGL